jgi:hypothetical protein
MPIQYAEGDEPYAIFEGRCVVEEADTFLEWLRNSYDPVADLGVCTDLHTALLQLLLGPKVRIARMPPDALLAGLLNDQRREVTP